MENNKKPKQEREKNGIENSDKTDRQKPAVKSEKLRYKNADSIYDL